MSRKNRKASTVAREIIADKNTEKAKRYFDKCLNILQAYNAYDVVDSAYLLFNMCLDAIKGRYKIQSQTLIMIVAVALYIVAPLDFLPDGIPGVGQMDDIGILVYVINACSAELNLYASWKERQSINYRR